jgi:hypothetical protein
MSREEIIKHLEYLKIAAMLDAKPESINAEILGEAIKVLKQQPSEDCISRQAAIDALWKALYEYEDKTEKQFLESGELEVDDWIQHRIFVQNMSDIDRQTILNLPPVTPQHKKGRWIKVGDRGFGWSDTVICKCSECEYQKEFTGKFDGQNLIVDMEHADNYCPNCGANMEEER